MEIEVLYYGEIWLWPYGDLNLINREHLKKSFVLIKKENTEKKVKLGQIKKPH